MKRKSARKIKDRWYAMYQTGKKWTVAVIVGDVESTPQVVGTYVSERNAALAAWRHSRRRITRREVAVRRAKNRGASRVRAAANAAVRRAYAAYAAHVARQAQEAVWGWHKATTVAGHDWDTIIVEGVNFDDSGSHKLAQKA